MFSKKSLPITIAFILLITLGTIGLAYGLWTDQLTINGNVQTGKLDVAWDQINYVITGDCQYNPNLSRDIFGFKALNVYPGFHCYVFAPVIDNSTVPVAFDFLYSPDKPEFVAVDCASKGM